MFDLECFQVAVAEYYGISKIDGTPPYSPAAHENTFDSDNCGQASPDLDLFGQGLVRLDRTLTVLVNTKSER